MRCTVERELALVSTRICGSWAFWDACGLRTTGSWPSGGSERSRPRPEPVTGASTSPSGGRLQGVVAVAEEGEVVLGHPAQEADGERGLVGVDALGRGALELGGQHEALAAHLRPVLDRLAHVLEHVAHRALELGAALLVALAVDRQQHPRLGELADGGLDHLAGDVAGHDLLERRRRRRGSRRAAGGR